MAFRLTLTVQDKSPVRMLFEQDRVTVGRAPSNDVIVPDPKVSKAHAIIEQTPEGHHQLHDRDSKNATFVGGERVTSSAPVVLSPGDEVHIGDSTFSYMPLVPATDAASSSRDVSSTESDAEVRAANIDSILQAVGRGLSEVATLWTRSDEMASGAVEAAIRRHVEALSAPEQRVLTHMAQIAASVLGLVHAESAANASNEHVSSEHDWGALPATLSDVLALPASVWRHLDERIAAQDNPFLETPTTNRITSALPRPTEDAESEAFRQLCTALQYVVAHHHAVLRGYEASVEAGGKALLRRISPRESVPDPGKTGVLMRVFGGGDSVPGWERMERQWRKLYHSDWRHVEEHLFRPSLLHVYQNYMQHPPDATEPPLSTPSSPNGHSAPEQSLT
jgi:pSer/pThr/pTyr-binding forkhead associated (FHA) protein